MPKTRCDNCKSKITRKGCGVCKDNPYLCDNWEKEEPKVLTVDEWIKLENIDAIPNMSTAQLIKEWVRGTAKFFHQNGRLERDLELQPLGEAVAKYEDKLGDYDSRNELAKVYCNLKPLEEE